MSAAGMPAICVTITPRFKADQIDCLHVVLTIESGSFQAGSTIVSFAGIKRSTFISPRDDIWQASDAVGNVPILRKEEEWLVLRDTSGPVIFDYHAIPSLNARETAAIDLRYDQRGLIGSGLSFLPTPPGDQIYRISVQWDLDGAPESTRAIWTFGEGPGAIEKVGPASILNDSVYMVGPIHSNPPSPESQVDYYGYYWFGDLPPNIAIIRDVHYAFFLKVSDFFDEPPSENNPYRSFVRNSSQAKFFGGTSFVRSHILDYDDQIAQVRDYDLVRRIAYEMVHNFLGLSVTSPDIDWLFEGIKHALSVYLPFRPPNQFRTGDYFQSTVNMLCMKYYTSPLLHLPHDEVLALARQHNAYAQELLAARSWAFVIGTDLAARKLVEQTKPPQRPIEDLAIKPLAARKRNGQPHGIEEWIALLTPLMGRDAEDRYRDMCSGKLILLPPELFGAKSHRFMPIKQEILDFGMDRESFDIGLVKGLKKGSRAEEAGLKEGDRIVWNSQLWRCVDDFEAELEVIVRRDAKDMKVKYWPRAWEKADSWQLIKITDDN
jgi:hypothetical protein